MHPLAPAPMSPHLAALAQQIQKQASIGKLSIPKEAPKPHSSIPSDTIQQTRQGDSENGAHRGLWVTHRCTGKGDQAKM